MSNRLDRIVRILVMLQSGLRCNALRLAEEHGVHRRTVFRDFAALRSLGFPVNFDVNTACYTLSSPNSSSSRLKIEQLAKFLFSLYRSGKPEYDVPQSAIRELLRSSIADGDASQKDFAISKSMAWLPENVTQLLHAIDRERAVIIDSSDDEFGAELKKVVPTALQYQNQHWEVIAVSETGETMGFPPESIVDFVEPMSDTPDQVTLNLPMESPPPRSTE